MSTNRHIASLKRKMFQIGGWLNTINPTKQSVQKPY